jgi:ribosomal protein S18 acetylase RimI-like enzyme
MSVEIRFGVPPGQELTIANLTFSTLGEFLNEFLSGRRDAVMLVASCLRSDRLIVALKDGVVVGCAGLEHSGKSFVEISLAKAVRVLGLKAYALAIFRFVMIFNKVFPTQAHIQSLAVIDKERGKGIGTKLLHFAIEDSRLNGFSQVKLEVADANNRARRLYERTGFTETKVQKIPYPFNKIVGIGKVIEMVYKL